MSAKRGSNKELKRFGNAEKGAVSVLAIMVLLLLTIAGIASLYTARTEIQIAGNERDYVSALTSSDVGINLAAQLLTNSSDPGPLLRTDQDWINPGNQGNRESNMGTFIRGFLDADPGDVPVNIALPANNFISDVSDTYYSAIHWGNAQGSSLDITQTKPLLEYSLYGFYNRDLGSGSSIRSLVESGYRNR